MGKSALILALAGLIIMTSAHLTQDSRQMETTQEEANYEGKVLAREIAHSGFDVIERRVRRNFTGVRGTWSRIRNQEGHYTISATGPAEGPVVISSTGVYRGFEYTINGQLSRDVVPVLDAFTVDGDIDDFQFDRNVVVSGLDTNPDGTDGTSEDVHAVLATRTDAYDTFRNRLIAANAPGVAAAPDILKGSPAFNLPLFAEAVRNYDGDYLAKYTSDKKLKNVTLGSRGDPGIVLATKDFTFEGRSKGYGILYALGDVTFKDDALWEGVVYAAKDGAEFQMEDDSKVYGAVMISAYQPDETLPDNEGDRGLPGGHFDIDVFNAPGQTKEQYHEHQYDDDYDATGVNLLSPTGCGRGGLCWTTNLANESGIILDVVNGSAGHGTYRIRSQAGTGCTNGGNGSSSSSTSWSGKKSSKKGWSDDDDDDGGGGSSSCSSTQAIAAADLSGNTQDGLAGVVLDARKVQEISFDFTALCALRLSTPGHVQQDATNRNGSFVVRIYRATYSGNQWRKGSLVYELAVYHHAGYGKWVLEEAAQCAAQVGAGETGDVSEVVRYGNPIDITMKNRARIQYSSRAVRNLRSLYEEFDFLEGGIVRSQVRESVRAIRP